MAYNGTQSESCPSQMELAGYLDNRLADVDRRRLEDHLAICDECLEMVCEARTLLDVTGTPDVPASVAAQAKALRRPSPTTRQHQHGPLRFVGEWGLAAAAAIVLCFLSYQAGTRSGEAPATGADELISVVSFGALDPNTGFELELELESVLLAQEVSP
jgi:anti-sigma factor RsiW